jgi:ribosome recycling factor
MEADMEIHVKTAEEAMEKAIEHLQHELGKVRTGKAASNMFDGIMANYYGSPTPINQMANITTADARTVIIQPWDRTAMGAIEKAIFEANLGITPQNDGEHIRLSIPPLTEDRRKEMVKRVKHLGEDAKISIRNARQKLIDHIRKAVKEGYPEDMGKRQENKAQDIVNAFSAKVDNMVKAKDHEIMTV